MKNTIIIVIAIAIGMTFTAFYRVILDLFGLGSKAEHQHAINAVDFDVNNLHLKEENYRAIADSLHQHMAKHFDSTGSFEDVRNLLLPLNPDELRSIIHYFDVRDDKFFGFSVFSGNLLEWFNYEQAGGNLIPWFDSEVDQLREIFAKADIVW